MACRGKGLVASLALTGALLGGVANADDLPPDAIGAVPKRETKALELGRLSPSQIQLRGDERRGGDPPPTITIARPDTSWARITVDRAANLEGAPAFRVTARQLGAGVLIRFADRPAGMTIGGPVTLPGRMPLAARLSSGFGWREHPLLGGRRGHFGVDLAAPLGTPVRATSDGVVRVAGWQGGYGLLVALDHAAGLETRYAHLSHLSVARGESVKAGDVVGFVGSTGRSTGPHLHYETRVYGAAVDPLRGLEHAYRHSARR